MTPSTLHTSRKSLRLLDNKLSRQEGDQMLDLVVKGMNREMFKSATRRQQFISDPITSETCVQTKNTDFEQLKPMFDISKIDPEIRTDRQFVGSQRSNGILLLGGRSALLHDREVKLSTAKCTYTLIPFLVLERCTNILSL